MYLNERIPVLFISMRIAASRAWVIAFRPNNPRSAEIMLVGLKAEVIATLIAHQKK